MNTLGDVVAEVQGLLGDPDGEWVTRDYILGFIGTSYRLMYLNMKNATGRNLEALVEVLDLPAGTTSLYPQQAPQQPLSGLTDPLQLWWKPAGMPAGHYRLGNPRETLPFTDGVALQGASPAASLSWTWRGNRLTVTPLNQPIDICVDGRFNPPPLVEDEQILVISPDAQTPLALAAASLAGVERTNPQVLQGYADQAIASIDNIIADIQRQKQSFPKRLGRVSPQTGCGWFWAR